MGDRPVARPPPIEEVCKQIFPCLQFPPSQCCAAHVSQWRKDSENTEHSLQLQLNNNWGLVSHYERIQRNVRGKNTNGRNAKNKYKIHIVTQRKRPIMLSLV
jgi:hypothetical protein